ncbi:unnamed protein product [Dicrocoelium dendriticum]|nr:unnamed protein product [Dicrocoelium dendriticum]
MDDDDLTQDIIDQFDLICTQHQLDNSRTASRVPNGTFSDNFKVQPGTGLERTKSLDTHITNPIAIPRSLHGVTKDDAACPEFVERREYDNVQKEVVRLREELYMKLGELATIKESANRVNATKSDAIVRLEHSLNTEREEFQRRLNELNTQIAFREADYRLVTTELVRLKEKLSATKVTQDRAADFSPSSQLLVSAAASPYLDKAAQLPISQHRQPSPIRHLPVSIPPVPSKRSARYADGTWSVPTAVRSVPSVSSAAPLNGHRAPEHLAQPSGRLFEDTEMHETPRKRRRSANSYVEGAPSDGHAISRGLNPSVDAAVETEDFLSTPAAEHTRKLCYRISTRSTNSCYPHWLHESLTFPAHSTPFDLASDLIRLGLTDVSTTTAVCENDNLSSNMESARPGFELQKCTTPLSESSHSTWNSAYKHLLGVEMLMKPDDEWTRPALNKSSPQDSLSRVLRYTRTLMASLDNLIPHMEEIFKFVPTILDPSARFRLSSIDALPLHRDDEVPPSASTSYPIRGCEEEVISSFTEDPFAGAPASQIVAPFPRTTSHKAHPGPRGLTGIASTAPAEVHLSIAVPVSTVPRFSTDSELHLPPQDLSIVRRGLLCLKQLQCITLALQNWQLLASFYVRRDQTETDGSVNVDESEFSTSYRRIGALLASFIKELTKQHIARWLLIKKSTNATSSQQYTPYCELPSTASTYPLPRSHYTPASTMDKLCQLSQIDTKQILLLQRFSSCVLDLAALVASCTQRAASICPINTTSHSPIFHLSLVFCLILTSTGMKLPHVTHTVDGFNSFHSTPLVGYTPVYSASLLALVRLLRCMVSSAHWNVGHETGAWWAAHLTESDGDPGPDHLLDCLRSILGSKMNCRLLAVVSWIRSAADQITSLSVSHESNETNSSDPFGLSHGEKRNVQMIELLDEFSAFVASLAIRDDVTWPDSCPCKAEVYAALVNMATIPLETLLTIPSTLNLESDPYSSRETRHLRYIESRCVAALGQLTRALIALLWRHGDTCFQTHTDSLPSYFWLISSLSGWMRQSRVLLQTDSQATPSVTIRLRETTLLPELVEELHDFDSGTETNTKPT